MRWFLAKISEEFAEGEMSFFKVQVKKNETHILMDGEEHS